MASQPTMQNIGACVRWFLYWLLQWPEKSTVIQAVTDSYLRMLEVTNNLGGGWTNPLKNISQIGSFPQVSGEK